MRPIHPLERDALMTRQSLRSQPCHAFGLFDGVTGKHDEGLFFGRHFADEAKPVFEFLIALRSVHERCRFTVSPDNAILQFTFWDPEPNAGSLPGQPSGSKHTVWISSTPKRRVISGSKRVVQAALSIYFLR